MSSAFPLRKRESRNRGWMDESEGKAFSYFCKAKGNVSDFPIAVTKINAKL